MASIPGQTHATPTTAAQVLDVPPTPAAGASLPTPTQPAQPAAGEDGKVSGKLQLLIQREKAALERERAAKAQEATLAERLARIDEFESVKKTNPRKALELLGLSYQDLTQAELNDGQITPEVEIKKVREEFHSYVSAQEEAERKSQEDAQKQHEQAALKAANQFKEEIGKYLKADESKYELIAFEACQDLVYDVIDEHYNRTQRAAIEQAQSEDPDADISSVRGEVLTIAQAADKVELHLEQKYLKAKELKKVSAFMSQKVTPKAPTQPTSDKPSLPSRQTPQTLSNNLSATPTQPRKTARTDDERIAAAIAYARGLRP